MELWGVIGNGSKSQRDGGKNLHEKTGCMVFGGGLGYIWFLGGILGYTWESRDGYVMMMQACREHIIGYQCTSTHGERSSHLSHV